MKGPKKFFSSVGNVGRIQKILYDNKNKGQNRDRFYGSCGKANDNVKNITFFDLELWCWKQFFVNSSKILKTMMDFVHRRRF